MSSFASIVTPSQTQDEEAHDDDEQVVLLGSLQVAVVGIRYYQGVAHPGEFVRLVREPQNPYDENAIRVDNLRHQKVGHIKKETARALSQVMDKFPTVTIDGTIPYAGNEYTLPCLVEIFGKDAVDLAKVDSVFKACGMRWVMNPSLNPTTTATSAPVVVDKKSVDWQSTQRNLDDMFEQLSNEQLSSLPDIPMPSSLVSKGSLFDHQKQGIRWLYHHEMGDMPIPFFKKVKEGGKDVWFSEITNSSQPTAPNAIMGSILADDMGLGKTLQAIGLILANRPKASDLFKTTLVLCPVSVMSNWMQQIEEHVQPETLRVAVYHGIDRDQLLSNLHDVDVLISSYGTISTDFGNEFPQHSTDKKCGRKTKKAKKCASIFQQTFHRIILDEAHVIRNIKSRAFRGCCRLQATYRLCMTGTPLQNKPDDILSLLSFLSVEPLNDKEVFRRAVTQPIVNGDDVGLARLRTVMAHVALRRNKSTLNFKMAKKVVELRSIEFPACSPHKEIHDILFKSAQVVVRATLGAGDDKAIKNYMMILETLTRIRQACVSGDLIPKERVEAAEMVLAEVGNKGQLSPEEGEALLKKLKNAFDEAEPAECAVCLDEMEEGEAVILKSCAHVFCEPCVSKISAECCGFCPLCRQTFAPSDMVKKSIASAAASADSAFNLRRSSDLGPSPKLEALLQAIAEMKPDEKGVIFSQFKKFLDIIGPFMTARGFNFVRIDGSNTAAQRIAAMKEFAADGGPRFILCSLHAAGTGITLHRANHCFMMDTWWNGSIEDQAMDRVHRIGQSRDVRVIRFVMKDSIEGRMIALQEAKAALGKGAMEKLNPEEFRKARIGDLKSLFSIRER